MPEEEIAELQEANPEWADDGPSCEVWPENVKSIRLFLAVMTQWRRDTNTGMPTGLDYNGVEAGLRMMGRKVSRKHFDDLQVMEVAYVAESLRLFRRAQETRP